MARCIYYPTGQYNWGLAVQTLNLNQPGIVEIAEDGRNLAIQRGFLVITHNHEPIAKIAMDDIHALILSANQIQFSKNIMVECAERNIIMVICGYNYLPTALVIPHNGHFNATAMLENQIALTKPLKNRLWQGIVQQKIKNQAHIVQKNHGPIASYLKLMALVERVESADKTNQEAVAARLYWPALMGATFKREQDGTDIINIACNYGYAILRATVARALVGNGFNTALGLFHHNKLNPFCLVDDIMEPYRPIIDFFVVQNAPQWAQTGATKLTPAIKQQLVKCMQFELQNTQGLVPAYIAIQRAIEIMAHTYKTKKYQTDWGILI